MTPNPQPSAPRHSSQAPNEIIDIKLQSGVRNPNPESGERAGPGLRPAARVEERRHHIHMHMHMHIHIHRHTNTNTHAYKHYKDIHTHTHTHTHTHIHIHTHTPGERAGPGLRPAARVAERRHLHLQAQRLGGAQPPCGGRAPGPGLDPAPQNLNYALYTMSCKPFTLNHKS